MKKRLPPLNWLRTFEATARHLNFTQAAVELNQTQAAISQQIKGLETQLGTPLFNRLPRGLSMTDAGKAYLPVVHECIRRLNTATDEIFGQGKARLLNVRSSLVFLTCWLAPRFKSFRERYPNVDVRFSSHIWNDEYKGESDLEICYGQGAWPGMEADRLTWDELIPVCSSIMSSGRQPPASPAELSEHTLLHVIGYEDGWGHWLDQAGYPDLKFRNELQFDTLVSALQVARYGDGVALGRSSLVSEMISNGELIAPFKQGVKTSEAFYLVRPANQYIHPHAEIFRTWILEEAEKGDYQQICEQSA